MKITELEKAIAANTWLTENEVHVLMLAIAHCAEPQYPELAKSIFKIIDKSEKKETQLSLYQ